MPVDFTCSAQWSKISSKCWFQLEGDDACMYECELEGNDELHRK